MATLKDINHFVVLMLENRSFDNLFGLLPATAGGTVDGITGSQYNEDASGVRYLAQSAITSDHPFCIPSPDPGEAFVDINTQIFGNPDADGPPTMQGFVANYLDPNVGGTSGQEIMHCYAPSAAPALTTLATSFAVCDRWFASAPCQTWPNRFFVHTGTAGGYVNNVPVNFPYAMPTLFGALDPKVPNGWAVYFHDFPQSLTLSELWRHLDHFHGFDHFLDDARSGQLPSYAFIEPRYFPDLDFANDMHPPHNVAYADHLVLQVYEALRTSPCWDSTMFIITFDEHGGCYDHVAPPAVCPPANPAPAVPAQTTGPKGKAFHFDRLGVRVPAVVISPFIPPGTIFRAPEGQQPFDHTAIIKTLRKRFDIDTALTDRDANAPDLEPLLSLPAASNAGPAHLTAATLPDDAGGEALERARLAPMSAFQDAANKASAYLAPLMHGVSVESHVAALLDGTFAPPASDAYNSIDALQNIRNVIDRLVPRGGPQAK